MRRVEYTPLHCIKCALDLLVRSESIYVLQTTHFSQKMTRECAVHSTRKGYENISSISGIPRVHRRIYSQFLSRLTTMHTRTNAPFWHMTAWHLSDFQWENSSAFSGKSVIKLHSEKLHSNMWRCFTYRKMLANNKIEGAANPIVASSSCVGWKFVPVGLTSLFNWPDKRSYRCLFHSADCF